jgi:hypothetical protein
MGCWGNKGSMGSWVLGVGQIREVGQIGKLGFGEIWEVKVKTAGCSLFPVP